MGIEGSLVGTHFLLLSTKDWGLKIQAEDPGHRISGLRFGIWSLAPNHEPVSPHPIIYPIQTLSFHFNLLCAVYIRFSSTAIILH